MYVLAIVILIITYHSLADLYYYFVEKRKDVGRDIYLSCDIGKDTEVIFGNSVSMNEKYTIVLSQSN
jgi:hypothetical protein